MMVREIVEQLKNGIIAGPDDLAGIGECINLIENLENEAIDLPPVSSQTIYSHSRSFSGGSFSRKWDPEHDWEEIQRTDQRTREPTPRRGFSRRFYGASGSDGCILLLVLTLLLGSRNKRNRSRLNFRIRSF